MQFKVGDRVCRNYIQKIDSDAVPINTVGTIIQVRTQSGKLYGDQPYLVVWDIEKYNHEKLHWWMAPGCFDIETPKSKEDRIIDKIKYLDKLYKERKHANNSTSF